MKHLQIAISELGKEETPRGSNWGPHIQKYLKSVGINFPASWCMAFVYWCVEEAKVRVADGTGGLRNPLLKTGGVLKQWNDIEKQFKQPKCKFNTPAVGDIFIMDYGKGFGHTGFVEKVEGDKIHTIEGNTNDEGDREGYEVARRIRKISSCKGFIRII
jgi:hypothetical protein